MKKWMLSILVLAIAAIIGSCGGKKVKDTGLGGADQILFINDTSENTYRVTVVGTDVDFTLRSSTQKAVKIPAREDDPSFNVNIERTEGTSGETRVSLVARGGDTIRIYGQALSFGGYEEIVFELE